MVSILKRSVCSCVWFACVHVSFMRGSPVECRPALDNTKVVYIINSDSLFWHSTKQLFKNNSLLASQSESERDSKYEAEHTQTLFSRWWLCLSCLKMQHCTDSSISSRFPSSNLCIHRAPQNNNVILFHVYDRLVRHRCSVDAVKRSMEFRHRGIEKGHLNWRTFQKSDLTKLIFVKSVMM